MQLSPPTMGRITVVLGTAAVATHQLILLLTTLGGLVFMLIAGVVLPAVWSTKSSRRQAASTVLDQLLATLAAKPPNDRRPHRQGASRSRTAAARPATATHQSSQSTRSPGLATPPHTVNPDQDQPTRKPTPQRTPDNTKFIPHPMKTRATRHP